MADKICTVSLPSGMRLFILLLFCAQYVSASLSVIDHSLVFSTIPIQGQDIRIAVLTVVFDGDVYLNHQQLISNLTGVFQQQGGGGGNNDMPLISMATAGVARVSCGGGFHRESYQGGGGNQGPPDFLMNGPTSPEPTPSALKLIGGSSTTRVINGVSYPEVWASNEYVGIVFMDGGGFTQNSDFLACSPTITFPGNIDSTLNPNFGRNLTDVNGVPLHTSVTFLTETTPVCKDQALTEWTIDEAALLYRMSQASSQLEFGNLQFLAASLLTRSAWSACGAFVNSKITYTPVDVVLTGITTCVFAYGSTGFAASPCCNRTLTFTQCCSPYSVTVTEQRATGVKNVSTCQHPVAISSLLLDYAAADQKAKAEAALSGTQNGQENDWSKYMAPVQTCQNTITNHACTDNSQCLYSNVCDPNQAICQTPWQNLSYAFAKCYITNFLPEMRFELQKTLGVAYSADLDTQTALLLPAFLARVTANDCTGPNAWQFQSRYDNNLQTWVPGNQTGCLLQQSCSVEPWNYMTKQACLARTYPICATFDGRTYNDLTRNPAWNSSVACANGLCSVQSLQFQPINASVCLAAGISCNLPCAQCQTWNFQNKLCYKPNFSTCNNFGAGEQLVANGHVCQVPCSTIGHAEFVCSNITDSSLCSPQDPHYLAEALGCNYNTYGSCSDTASCNAAGQCDDWEFQQCACSPGQPCVCTSSVCVIPFAVDQYGNRQGCAQPDPTVNTFSRIGCIKSSLTSNSTCRAGGGTWHTKATTQNQCLAHGQGCDLGTGGGPWSYSILNDMNTCGSCGGVSRSLYTWKFGVARPAAMIPTVQVVPTYGPVNTWGPTISNQLENALFQDVIASLVGRKNANVYNARYSRSVPLVQTIVCDCLTTNTDCLIKYNATVVDEQCRQDPGATTTCGALTYTSFDATLPSSDVTAFAILPSVYTAQLQNSTATTVSHRRRLLSVCPNNPALVVNDLCQTVGVIVSAGVSLTIINGSSVTITFIQDSFPDTFPDFTVFDLVFFNGSVGHAQPLNITLTSPSTNVYVYVNATKAGNYFLILRPLLWQTYVTPPEVVVVVVAVVVTPVDSLDWDATWWFWFVTSVVIVAVIVVSAYLLGVNAYRLRKMRYKRVDT